MTYLPHLSGVVIVLSVLGALNRACSDELMTDSDVANMNDSPLLRVAPAAGAAEHTYEVTIENLTTAQPVSPGIIVTHTKKTNLFEVGEATSEGIRYIAEMGNPPVAVSELNANSEAYDIVPTGSPVGPGGTHTVEVEGRTNADRLSLAVMLVCTNDGFTGLESIKLPGGFDAQTFEVEAYDAGTEANDETAETVIDGCPAASDENNLRTATDEPIMQHSGIQGGAALDPGVYDWTDPVARVTVRRLK